MSHEDDDMFIVNGNRPTCVSVSSEELWNFLAIITIYIINTEGTYSKDV